MVKNFKQFESKIKWYSKGEFTDDHSEIEEKEDIFNIGDSCYMKNPKNSIYRKKDGNWSLDDSKYYKGEKLEFHVVFIKEINGELCINNDKSGSQYYYRTSHLSKTKEEALEESIKWYSKGEFINDPKDKSENIPEFHTGQKIKIINTKNAYWDEYDMCFRNSRRLIGFSF